MNTTQNTLTIALNKPNISTNANIKQTNTNTFEITGTDLTIPATYELNHIEQLNNYKNTITITKLIVTYNHDGLLNDITKNNTIDTYRLLQDIDLHTRFESILHTIIEDIDNYGNIAQIENFPIHEDNSLNIYIDFVIIDKKLGDYLRTCVNGENETFYFAITDTINKATYKVSNEFEAEDIIAELLNKNFANKDVMHLWEDCGIQVLRRLVVTDINNKLKEVEDYYEELTYCFDILRDKEGRFSVRYKGV